MLSQTVKPCEWVIVDDGSTDATGKIISAYTREYSWIRLICRTNRGFRKAGGGVIEAFYEGYTSMRTKSWDYIVKLDGDLSFDHDYFEKCFKFFLQISKLGIAGGAIFNVVNGTLEKESHPLFHVRGATKIYKRECWDAIGGLLRAPGWDTIDELKANMLGWKTQTITGLKVAHYRSTGQADGTWKTNVKYGRANYISGYHPLFMLFKSLKRTVNKPYLIGSIALAYGFLSGYVKKIPQIDDKELITYVRR